MTYDLIVLAILVFSAIRGAIKGLVWQLAIIATLVLCFAFSGTGSVLIAPKIPLDPPLNRWVAMLVLYIVLSFAAFGVARLLHGWIEKMKFKEYDRHLGFLFGLIKGITFCLVLTFFIVTLSEGQRGNVMASYSGHAAAIIMDRLHPVMPQELHDVLEPYIHQLDRAGMNLEHSHANGELEHSQKNHENHSADDHDDDASLIDRLLAEIKGEENGEWPSLRRALLEYGLTDALANTSAADRDELLDKLKSAGPEEFRVIANAWKNGKPFNVVDSPPLYDEPVFEERGLLLLEIAAAFSNVPAAEDTIIEEIERSLSGLPDRVAIAVLRDWHADLKKTTRDPDPQTDESIPLDARIVRQLSLAGVPLTTLSSSLQDRLRDSLQR
jgi:membrane protein required for colicin V production